MTLDTRPLQVVLISRAAENALLRSVPAYATGGIYTDTPGRVRYLHRHLRRAAEEHRDVFALRQVVTWTEQVVLARPTGLPWHDTGVGV